MKKKTGYAVLLSLFLLSLTGFGIAAYLLTTLPSSRQTMLVGGPFQLVAQDGEIVTEKDLVGKPTLIFFGYTHCPDVCPTTLFQVSEVLKALGTDAQINVFFVSVDPARDTQASLKDYIASFDSRIKGLSGDQTAIDSIVKAFRVYAKKVPSANGDYTMDHTAMVYLMDKTGKFVSAFPLDRTPEAAAAQLRSYM